MDAVTIYLLILVLLFFVLLSAFFSGSETGMMALNRYRLRHLVRKKHKAATRVNQLLQRVDRLLGIILIGNTFANIIASALATLIAVHLFGEVGVLIASVILTFVVLIFAEIIPKTIAATYPERVAFIVSLPLKILLKVLYPIVWLANAIVNALLKLFKVEVKKSVLEPLTSEELRVAVSEAGGQIPSDHQEMLLNILDLEKRTVTDVMVPRNEIIGLDIEKSWPDILQQLVRTKHSYRIVFRNNIEQVQGVLYLPEVIQLLINKKLTKTSLLKKVKNITFVPEGTSLTAQLLSFQTSKSHIALVVDEYGDIQGLLSLIDIVQLIVGRFVVRSGKVVKVQSTKEGGFLVAGNMNIAELNKTMGWELPTTGPKTINGLLVEYLETIPTNPVAVRVAGYHIEIIEVRGNMVNRVLIQPLLRE